MALRQCVQIKLNDLIDSYGISKNNFNIVHMNMRSLRKKFWKARRAYNPDIIEICLSETFLYPNEHGRYILPNYTFVGDSRHTRCGGAGIYVRSGLALRTVPVSLGGAGSLAMRFEDAGKGSLCVICIYCKPSSDAGVFLDSLELLLHSCGLKSTGDLNIAISKHSNISQKYLNITSQYNFHHLITVPIPASHHTPKPALITC